jgi:hypothetical protein
MGSLYVIRPVVDEVLTPTTTTVQRAGVLIFRAPSFKRIKHGLTKPLQAVNQKSSQGIRIQKRQGDQLPLLLPTGPGLLGGPGVPALFWFRLPL